MRKSLDALMPRVRQQILAAFLLNPEQEWYLSDLARHYSTTPSSLQRELSSLCDAEILVKRRSGNRTYYRANTDSPIFPDLRMLLTKTCGLIDILKEAFSGMGPDIRVALVFGSVAEGAERSRSDVDVLIIGNVRLLDLAAALRKAEERLARSVNISLYSEKEFRMKLLARNHFLSTIVNGAKLFIIGAASDLAAVGERRAG